MYTEWHYADRDLRERKLAERMAERRRFALAGCPSPALPESAAGADASYASLGHGGT